jgi:tRNA (cytidine/uridine-2'-O-)-methyltransferase
VTVHVVLVAPEIPQNTGSVGRLCVATDTPLHLVEPLGFRIDDKHVRRAGLDYWPHVDLRHHGSWAAFERARPGGRLLFFSSHAARTYLTPRYRPDDVLVFGGESRGFPSAVRAAYEDAMYAIPIDTPHVRSLNLATAVAIVLYEARRQLGGDA